MDVDALDEKHDDDLDSDQTRQFGTPNGLESRMSIELFENMLNMVVHGVWADMETLSNRPGRFPHTDQFENLSFSECQLGLAKGGVALMN